MVSWCFPQTEFIMRTPTPRPQLKATTEAPQGGRSDPGTPLTSSVDQVGQAPLLPGNRSQLSTTLAPSSRTPKPRKGGQRRGQRRKKKPPSTALPLRNGSVRLMRQQSRGWIQGRVEVYINGEWGTVCDDGWNSAAATVVCRQLGFPHVVRATKKAEFGEGSSLRILLDDVQCSGQEETLLECAHADVGTHNCSHEEDAGVVCSREEVADW